MILSRAIGLAVPIAIAGALLAWLLASKSPPQQVPPGETALAVRTLTLEAMPVVPMATGFGEVVPATVWQAVAEVSGRVVERHPRLEAGAILERETRLLRIDPTDYRLTLAQVEADIRALQAQLAENAVQTQNAQRSTEIEEASLRAAEKELERLRSLAARGTASQSQRDDQERQTLSQRQSLQQQRNALRLLPSQRELLEAQLARQQVQREAAQLDLKRTEVRLPFDARIAQVDVSLSEYVREGAVLAVADDIARAEVQAQVPISQMRGLLSLAQESTFDPTDAALIQRMGLSASVAPAGLPLAWPAEVVRLSPTIDPQTRTVGVVVSVDEPYRSARPGTRPPLVKGLFTQVTLRGMPRDAALVVPREALHADTVYVVNNELRLERREVELGLQQPEFVVVTAGLQAGDKVVVSDLSPAVEGMLLAPEDDEALAQTLRALVSGASQ